MEGTARVPGTCGELIQGSINGQNFLVTFPVEIYSKATVRLNKEESRIVNYQGLDKVKQGVKAVLEFLGFSHMGGEVIIESEIPHGKGMASSTADITAAAIATAMALGMRLTPQEIAQIALSIEPSDGIMFPNIALFDHINGSITKVIEPLPKLEVLILDLGGQIDTKSFNNQDDLVVKNKAKEKEIETALQVLMKGIKEGKPELIGKAATISALAHQSILYKPEIEKILDLAMEFGAYGINVAHSGTIVGILGIEENMIKKLIYKIEASLGRKLPNIKTRLCSGGGEVLREVRGEWKWMRYNTYMAETYGQKEKNMA